MSVSHPFLWWMDSHIEKIKYFFSEREREGIIIFDTVNFCYWHWAWVKSLSSARTIMKNHKEKMSNNESSLFGNLIVKQFCFFIFMLWTREKTYSYGFVWWCAASKFYILLPANCLAYPIHVSINHIFGDACLFRIETIFSCSSEVHTHSFAD